MARRLAQGLAHGTRIGGQHAHRESLLGVVSAAQREDLADEGGAAGGGGRRGEDEELLRGNRDEAVSRASGRHRVLYRAAAAPARSGRCGGTDGAVQQRG